jgi:hypothetical protein
MPISAEQWVCGVRTVEAALLKAAASGLGPSFGFQVNQGGASLCMKPQPRATTP